MCSLSSLITQQWYLWKEFIKNMLPYQSMVLPHGAAGPLCHIARYCSVAEVICVFGGFAELPVLSCLAGTDMKCLLLKGMFVESLMHSSGLCPQKRKAWGATRCLLGVIRIINVCVAMGLSCAGEMLSLPVILGCD